MVLTVHFNIPGKLALAALLLFASYNSNAETLTGRIVAIADGDTVTLLDANKQQHKIRLSGIDAPEHKQAFGNVSRQHLAGLVFGKQVSADCQKKRPIWEVDLHDRGRRDGCQPRPGRGWDGVALQGISAGSAARGSGALCGGGRSGAGGKEGALGRSKPAGTVGI